MTIPVVAIGGVDRARRRARLPGGRCGRGPGRHGDLRRPDAAGPARRRARRRVRRRAASRRTATSSARPCRSRPRPRPPRASSTGHDRERIGFLSFGHWSASPYSQVRSASDALLQSIELAVAAEELGADGAYFRVHHFARQLASPFPLLAAIGARTSRIEIGTAVIDMRYENPLYMVEDAGAADIIAGGRLQLGISRGSPEQVIDGFRYFGYAPGRGRDRRRHGPPARRGLPRGARAARASPSRTRGRCSPTRPGCSALEPHSPGLRDRIWWGPAPTRRPRGRPSWA